MVHGFGDKIIKQAKPSVCNLCITRGRDLARGSSPGALESSVSREKRSRR